MEGTRARARISRAAFATLIVSRHPRVPVLSFAETLLRVGLKWNKPNRGLARCFCALGLLATCEPARRMLGWLHRVGKQPPAGVQLLSHVWPGLLRVLAVPHVARLTWNRFHHPAPSGSLGWHHCFGVGAPPVQPLTSGGLGRPWVGMPTIGGWCVGWLWL